MVGGLHVYLLQDCLKNSFHLENPKKCPCFGREIQSTALHGFCWRDWGRSLLLAAPRLVTLILQWCSEMAELSCTAPWGFVSSAGIHQQFPSPAVGTLFTDTILAKTSSVLEHKKSFFSLACFYNFVFFFMLITSAVLWGRGIYMYPGIFRYKHTN